VGDEFLVGNFRVFGQSTGKGEVDVGILVAPEGRGHRCDDERDLAVSETVQRCGAALEDVRVRALWVPGKTVESGQDGYTTGMTGKYLEKETKTVGEGLSAAIGVADEESGAAEFVGEIGGDEGFGEALEAGKSNEIGVGT
jgi:hypothetical protein